MADKIEDQNENDEQNKDQPKEDDGFPFRKRLSSFRTFLTHFYVEQKENPFQALIGPGPGNTQSFWLTHLWYIFILSFIPVCSLLSTVGFIQPYLASDSTLCDWKREPKTCETVIIVFITYRIGFSVSIFFLFTALLLSKRKSKDIQKEGFSTLHTGFWIEKVIAVLVLCCVTFAFPPVVFDAVWIYVVLLGDLILSTVLLFLLCDFITFIYELMVNRLTKQKKQNCEKSVEIVLCIVGFILLLTCLLSSIYTIEYTDDNGGIVVYLTLLTIFLTGQLIYVFYGRKNELYYCFYASIFCYFLSWNFLINYRTYTETTDKMQHGIWTASSVIMLIILYMLVIYAVIRRDDRAHFYYFHWIVCSGGTVNRTVIEPDLKPRYVNPNETLISNSSFGGVDRNYAPHDSLEYDVVYSESFIHLFMCLVSLKSTAVVTNYRVLMEINEELQAHISTASIITLFITSVLVCILFTAYLAVSADNDNDALSVGLLLKSIIRIIGFYFSKIMFGRPNALSRPALTRLVYYIFFSLCFILACVTISPSFKHYFQRISFFCDHVTSMGACMSHDPAFTTLYRIFATVAIFFMLIGLVTSFINPSNRLRNDIYNGCWPVKIILLFAIFACVVNLPNKMSRYWLYFDLVSILIFTLLQLFCLIDAITIATQSCKMDNNSSINASSTGITILLYAISLIAYVSFYVYYAHNYQCAVTRFFVSINLVLCISASIISIHPDVQTGNLLLSAVVTSLCMYSTWSALNYNPEEKCNPLAHTLMLVEARPGRDVVSVTDLLFLFITLTYFIVRVKEVSASAYDLSLSLIVKHLMKRKTDEINVMERQAEAEDKVRDWLDKCKDVSKETIDENRAKHTKRGEQDKDETDLMFEKEDYFSTLFTLSMACSYCFLLLAHWLEPIPGSGFKVSLHWAIMSVKLIGSSFCVLTYIWILVLPVVTSKLSGDAV
ncbi:uncharacterized protein [Clytia hemisphaerica]|uniref:Uncharacterized protein n=1 Tax=Clytia hemisphaerica TaxID=252671 RepID=A0A7M5TZN4_9CNID